VTGTAVQKAEPLKAMLAKATETIRAIVPQHIDPERVTRVAYLACYRDEKLRTADAVSVVNAVVAAASLGLEIGGPAGEAYLVAFWNGKKRITEAQMIPGYRGLVKLARQSEKVLNVEARVVYKADFLEVEYGDNPRLKHLPDLEAVDPKDEDIVGAYAIAWLKDAPRPTFVYLNRAQIEKRRAVSQAGDTGPWRQWYPEQCRKTAVKQLVKLIPSNRDLATALELDNRAETGESSAVLDGLDTPEEIAAQVRSKTSEKAESIKKRLVAGQEKVPVDVAVKNLELDREMAESERAAESDAKPGRLL